MLIIIRAIGISCIIAAVICLAVACRSAFPQTAPCEDRDVARCQLAIMAGKIGGEAAVSAHNEAELKLAQRREKEWSEYFSAYIGASPKLSENLK